MNATPWTASYPPDLRWDSPIPLRAFGTILDDAVARFADRPALEFMGRQARRIPGVKRRNRIRRSR